MPSFERNANARLKIALHGNTLPPIGDLWSSANWYEREVRDMFGITFDGHPQLSQILMPPKGDRCYRPSRGRWMKAGY